MCTVSFVPSDDQVIITSNRDEQVLRPAIEPQKYIQNGKTVIFPKDPKAGGTWFVADEKGTVLVLLNGAAEKHQHLPPYRKSRGLIVLDIIGSESPKSFWHTIDLDNVEPFTLVLFEQGHLYQLQWDGVTKTKLTLDASKNHIWSSSTLYPKDIRAQRAQWFEDFLSSKTEISAVELFHFHRYTETGNTTNGLVINRNDLLQTLTITQAVIAKDAIKLFHHDLISEKEFSETFATL